MIKNTSKKIAIIVGDGVRYEVADSVASRVASDISVDKKFMYAGLPSETEHNMSALYTNFNMVELGPRSSGKSYIQRSYAICIAYVWWTGNSCKVICE